MRVLCFSVTIILFDRAGLIDVVFRVEISKMGNNDLYKEKKIYFAQGDVELF